MRSAIYQAINGSASGSIVSESIPTDYMTQCSVIVVVAGATSPVGVVKLQASNDISNAFPIGNYDPTNWVDVPLADVSVSANGTYVIPTTGLSYGFVRAVWTYSSGSGGTIAVNVSLSDGSLGQGGAVTLPPRVGNIALVDSVNGNDSAASINGFPFKTVEAGLAAISAAGTPATLWVMPGTYTLASATTGLTMPTGCTMRVV